MAPNLPSDWDSRRKTVYQRDNHTCQNCGAQGEKHSQVEIHAHHIVPKARGGSHKTTNLISLCKECHNTVHSKSKKAPTSHRQTAGPDYGKLSDKILTSILQMIEAANGLMNRDPNLSVREYRDQLVENAPQLRSTSLTITESVEKLDSLPTDDYPQEVVKSSDKAIDAGIGTIEPMLEAIEYLTEKMDEAVEDILSCPSCDAEIDANAQFCSSCGTEIEHDLEDCAECGTEIGLTDTACPSCGATSEFESDEANEIINNIEDSVDEMEKSAENFKLKLKNRTEVIEKHS